MAPQKKKLKSYKEEVGFKKSPKQQGSLRMKDVSTSFKVDEKKLVKELMKVASKREDDDDGDRTDPMAIDPKQMKLEDKNIARVLPGRITNVKFLPTNHIKMLVAGNKYGNLGFWNMDDDGIYVFYPHSGPVSGISIHSFSLSKLISSCYHGFIRLLEAEKENFGLAYSSEHEIFSIGRANDDINTLFFGEGYGSVGSLDLRSCSKHSESWSLHGNKINTIDFNSQNKNIMATSCADGTACIWDVRKLDQVDPEPLKLVKHKKAVNSAYFSPSGSLLATTSIDDSIGVISGANYEVETMIYHSNSTSRWISSLRGVWGWDDSCIMVANLKKGVDIISAVDKKLIYTLSSTAVVSAVPCRLDVHPIMLGLLAGSTAGGQVCVWDI